MGILDDYMNGVEVKEPAPVPTGGSLINDYMATPAVATTAPAPVASNIPRPFTAAEAAEASKPKPNPRDSILWDAVTNLPKNVGNAIVKDATSSAASVGEGFSDITSNRPATGVGKVGMGLLGAIASPITGASKELIEKPVTELTGNKDIGERAGIVATSGLPIVKGTKAVVAQIPKNKALSTLIESIGPENAGAVAKAMRENPRLTPADLSPKVLQDTQHLFANDGPQINYLKNTSDNRMATRKDTITDAYDASAGTPVNVVQKLADLANASREVGSSQINPALKAAGPVDVSPTLTAIDTLLKPGTLKVGDAVPLTSVKKELENIRRNLRASKEYKAEDLNEYQSSLRVTANDLMKSADGDKRSLGNAIMKVRNDLVSDIDKATGGKYKPALSSYKDEIDIANAFRDGYSNVLSNSSKMEGRPEFTRKWFEGLSDAEKTAAIEGVRTAIGTEIGKAKNGALAGESLARSDFNKEKLQIILGEKEANKLIKTLEDERAIANTHNKITEGSQTAMRTASKDQFALPTGKDAVAGLLPPAIIEGASAMTSGLPGLGTATYMLAKGGSKLKNAIDMKLAREHNAQYAKLALPSDGPEREALIQALEAVASPPRKQSILRRAISTAIPP